MVTHFRNEELLLPFFIIHHAPMFDQVSGSVWKIVKVLVAGSRILGEKKHGMYGMVV